MDIDIGRILDRLEELGLREDTLVVFTSDNGFSCGHHGFLSAKQSTVRHSQYVNLKKTASRFALAVPDKRLHEITATDVEGWLQSLRVKPKTWNNYRSELNHFFAWCIDRESPWIESNPVKRIVHHKIRMGIPEILTVSEATALMEHVENYRRHRRSQKGEWSLFFALALFAGIRPDFVHGEMAKLSKLGLANFVDLDNNVIRITPDVAKTKDLRSITIQPNLREWLLRYPPETTRLIPSDPTHAYVDIRKGFGLAHDVLRHSFISYHVGQFRSIGDTALQAGNSERMIKKHYLNLVHDASEFWQITPKDGRGKVVNFEAVAS